MPILRVEVWSQWELWQARKLLEYGFIERAGALLEPALDSGQLAFPEDLNYTHHPHLMVWLYTALYAVGGAWLCFAYLLSLRLAGTLVLFILLRKYFSAAASWWAAVLYSMAPAALVMDVETNIIGIAAAYWPFAAWLATRVHETGRGSIVLGLFVFFGAQTSWLFLTLMPALLWLAAPSNTSWVDLIRRPFVLASSRAVLIGGGLSLIVFLLQLAWYTPNWPELLHYLRAQMGMARFTAIEETPRWKMAVLVGLRTALYIGPALCLGALVGAFTGRRERGSRLLKACLLFIAGYALVEAVLMRFSFVEVSPYTYLLMPFAALTAAALNSFGNRSFLTVLAVASCLAAGYFTIRDSIPKRGAAIVPLAQAFSEMTRSDDIVLTNLREYHPPFAAWDNSAGDLVRAYSDRLIFYGVRDAETLKSWRDQLKRNFRNVVFAFSPANPIDPEFHEWLEANSQENGRRVLEIPAEQPPGIAVKMRLALWTMTGRFKDRSVYNESSPRTTALEFYRLRL